MFRCYHYNVSHCLYSRCLRCGCTISSSSTTLQTILAGNIADFSSGGQDDGPHHVPPNMTAFNLEERAGNDPNSNVLLKVVIHCDSFMTNNTVAVWVYFQCLSWFQMLNKMSWSRWRKRSTLARGLAVYCFSFLFTFQRESTSFLGNFGMRHCFTTNLGEGVPFYCQFGRGSANMLGKIGRWLMSNFSYIPKIMLTVNWSFILWSKLNL